MSIALLGLIYNILNLLIFIIIAWDVVSWLLAFNIINTRNQVVFQIVKTLNALIDPLVSPIRRIMPNFGGLDFSPIILLFGIYFLQSWINQIARGNIL